MAAAASRRLLGVALEAAAVRSSHAVTGRTASVSTVAAAASAVNSIASSSEPPHISTSISLSMPSPRCTITPTTPQIRQFRVKSSNTSSDPSSSTFSSPDSSSSSSSSSTSSSSSSSRSRNPADEQSTDDAKVSDGMDLFSRALAAQRARQAAEFEKAGQRPDSAEEGAKAAASEAAAAGGSSDPYASFKGPQEDGSEQPLSPEEEERLRRLRDRAEAEEAKVVAKRGRWLLGVAGGVLMAVYAWMGTPKGDEPYGGIGDHHRRVMKGLTGGYKEVTGPTSTKLLPDPLPEGWQQRNTLFIELNDTLVHMTWDKSLGWRAALRPGAKKFLAYLSKYYEIVIFTNSHNYLAAPVLEALDPFSYYKRYSLYKDSTRLVNGKNVKDLSITNRDLSNCIIVDPDSASYQLQPENGVPIKPWRLEKGDKELARLTTFLEEVALMREVLGHPDIRVIMGEARKLDTEDVVNGWEIYKSKLRQAFQIKYGKQSESVNPGSKTNPLSDLVSSTFGALFGRGLKSVVANPTGPGGVDPNDIVGLLQLYARMEREAFEKEYVEKMNEMEELKKLQEQDIARQVQEMKDKKLTLKDYMAGGGVMPGGQQPQPGTAPAS
ncbi:mitochondrial inner membrane protein required for protein import [Dinochytrium kinnereticum]|nr:mitochondrial inner membrane protein required for protein import [Dinochytrium kinnereticum]